MDKLENTDIVGEEKDVKKSKPPGTNRGGKGARDRRNDNFRKGKNIETDNAIMSGIFARLKISDPTRIPAEPLAREVHPVTVPISFSAVPTVVDRVWDTMEAIGTRPFASLDTVENKKTFTKGTLILCEAKVCYAQRAHVAKPDEDLPSRKLYNDEELNDFNNMAGDLPYPLAIMLECIGNTSNGLQSVVPLIAEHRNEPALSGALNYSPRILVPLLRILRAGVPQNGVVHNVARALAQLPAMEWEQFVGPIVPPNLAGEQMIRITAACYDFWLTGEVGQEKINWNDRDYRTFMKIVKSMQSKKGFIIRTDLSHGMGSLAQIVQIPDYTVSTSCDWFTMDTCSEYDQKLGAAFGFGYYCNNIVQPSRFTGTKELAYWRGEITPRRILNAMLAGYD